MIGFFVLKSIGINLLTSLAPPTAPREGSNLRIKKYQ